MTDVQKKYEEHYVEWVRDAHAMEEQAESTLSSLAGRIDSYPELKTRLQQHLEETKVQKQKIKSILDRYNTSHSIIKDAMNKIASMGQSMVTMISSDEVVKSILGTYVFENIEIASYTSLIKTAELIGDQEGKRIFEENLKEEKAMAEWLLNHIPEITEQFLQRSADPNADAKN